MIYKSVALCYNDFHKVGPWANRSGPCLHIAQCTFLFGAEYQAYDIDSPLPLHCAFCFPEFFKF